MLKYLLLTSLASLLTVGLFAALPASEITTTGSDDVALTVKDEITTEDEFIFIDSDEKVCYIDFEKITINLKEVSLINQSGQVVFSEDVSDVPVDTIFEIDYSTFAGGKYIVEMKSYITSIHKRVIL
jgi:hypothetical protein